MDTVVTFETLPLAVGHLIERINSIEVLIKKASDGNGSDPDKWMDLDELINYDPNSRTKQTFYGMVAQRSIPYHKKGKHLYFLKSEIDKWLKSGRRKTNSEIQAEASSHILK